MDRRDDDVLLALFAACAHLGPYPSPKVDYTPPQALPLVQVAEDTQRLYVVVPTGSMGEQLWFFDTGYSHTTCDSQTLAALGVQTRPTLTRTRGELGTVRLERARLPDFTLGGHAVRGLRCAVRDLPQTSSIPAGEGYRVAGVLGANVLRQFVVEVDPAAGVLTLHAPGTVTLSEPFRLRHDRLHRPRLRVPLTLDGERTWPVLDYGASGTYLDAERLGLPLAEERTGTWRGTGATNTTVRTLRYHAAASTQLGEVPGPPLWVVDRAGAPWTPGLVGMDLLGQYHLIVDWQARQASAAPVAPRSLPLWPPPPPPSGCAEPEAGHPGSGHPGLGAVPEERPEACPPKPQVP